MLLRLLLALLVLVAPTTTPATRPYAGLWLREDGTGRTLVSRILPGPLEGRGFSSPHLNRGDTIVSVNGNSTTAEKFEQFVKSSHVGDEVVLQVKRTGNPQLSALPQAAADGKLEELRFKLADSRDWQGPVSFPRADSLSLENSLSAMDRIIAPTTAPTTAPTQLESFITSSIGSHGISAPIKELETLLAKMQHEDWGTNTLPCVAYGFMHPMRLLRLEKSITDPLPAIVNDPKQFLLQAADLLDVPRPKVEQKIEQKVEGGDETPSLEAIARVMEAADADVQRAFEKLQPEQRDELRRSIQRLLAQLAIPESIEASPHPERLILAMQTSSQIQYTPLLGAAARLCSVKFAPAAAASQPTTQRSVPGVTGEVLTAKQCAAGWIVIGGPGANTYDMAQLTAVIDVGGDDVYRYGKGERPRVQLIVDQSGDDRYLADDGAVPGPAGALMGVSVVVDDAGNDLYRGGAIACGAGVLGVGMIIDRAGNDRYECQSWGDGAGFYGAGAIIDTAGSDVYLGQINCQAIGGPRGVGLILDASGNDLYRANGPIPSAYETPAVFYAMSQGVGFGVRGYDSGGIGILQDLAGDDRYEGGEFSQGGGFVQGIGILHDRSGSDAYFGNRYSQGFAAHEAIGMLVDDAGDDSYWGMTAASQAGSWDLSIAMLLDRAGNDTYRADGLSQGAAAEQAIAWLVDLGGDDHYVGAGTAVQGQGSENSYHYFASKCFSFSLLIDAGGGRDFYSSGRENDKTVSTGKANDKQPEMSDLHGLFIDTADKLEAP